MTRTEARVHELFESLREHTLKLNEKTRGLNRVIEQFEQRLLDIQPGVTIWLKDHPLWPDGDGQHPTGWLLGYQKIGMWTLAVQHVRFKHHEDPTRSAPFWELDQYLDPPIQLQSAPRHIRLAAVPLLPTLLIKLDDRVYEMINSISQAIEPAQVPEDKPSTDDEGAPAGEPRDLDNVLGHILDVLPPEAETLRRRLEKMRSDLGFAPPEDAGRRWRRAQALLIKEIGQPDPGWQQEVARIFKGDCDGQV